MKQKPESQARKAANTESVAGAGPTRQAMASELAGDEARTEVDDGEMKRDLDSGHTHEAEVSVD